MAISTTNRGTDARRAATSGHRPESGSVRSKATNSRPKHAPTPTARATMRGGVLCWWVPSAPLTRATATTASPMPTKASVDGLSPSASPTTTGSTTPTTARTGATTLMSPWANPWYKPAIPSAPTMPPNAPHAHVAESGVAVPMTTTATTTSTRLTACPTTATTMLGWRRLALPPNQSPTP